MHDVACEFAHAVVRSKDAQNQLARTSLIARLHQPFLHNFENYKNTEFRGRPAANSTLMADCIWVAQPIRLQHLH